MENQYIKAIHHPDNYESLKAWRQFLMDEMDTILSQLHDLENDDGSIPEDNRSHWNYHKGRLDGIKTVHGMVVQRMMQVQDALDDVDIQPDET